MKLNFFLNTRILCIYMLILSALIYATHHYFTYHHKNLTIHTVMPCTHDDIISFFSQIAHNKDTLNQNVTINQLDNGIRKITLYNYNEDSRPKTTLYMHHNYGDHLDNCLYESTSRSGAIYYLYKGNLCNDGNTTYLLIYKHSGSGDYAGIIYGWAMKADNTFIANNMSTEIYSYLNTLENSFFDYPNYIANPFIITWNGNTYLRFQKTDLTDTASPTIYSYLWKNHTLEFCAELSTDDEPTYSENA